MSLVLEHPLELSIYLSAKRNISIDEIKGVQIVTPGVSSIGATLWANEGDRGSSFTLV